MARKKRVEQAEPPKTETGPPPRPWAVAALAVPSAAVFLLAAYYLPWKTFTTFSILNGTLGLLHLAVAIAGLARLRIWDGIWRIQSFFALFVFAYLAWAIASSAAYLAALYANLGSGVGASLLAALGPAALLTVPGALWGIAKTGGWTKKNAGTAAAIALAALASGPIRWTVAAPGREVLSEESVAAEIAQIEVKTATTTAQPLEARAPFDCAEPPAIGTKTVFAAYRGTRGENLSRCHRSIADAIALWKTSGARAPLLLDVVLRMRDLSNEPFLVSSFLLRPGLDGVCLGRKCFAPWQLIVLGELTAYTPLAFVGDFRLGVDPQKLRTRFGDMEKREGFGGLTRIATASYLVTESGAKTLRRLRSGLPAEVDRAAIDRAGRGAERYVRESQGSDGRFRYLLDPFTGTVPNNDFSAPRQSGTTLAFCELAPKDEISREVVERSLRSLAALVKNSGELGGIPPGGLGASALGLVAFLACRDRMGDRFDETIGRLSRLVLKLQREDGSFKPGFDLDRGEPREGSHALYADGQAILALVLLEKLQRDSPIASLPEKDTVSRAVEKAMSYHAGPYWDHALRDFFFFEENWACLAARAALDAHRHDGFERFCIDYAHYKSRMVFDEGSRVDPDFVGAFGFGNVTVPYNTPAAGFAEAMSAAIMVMKARGEPTKEEEAALTRALRFLLMAQWHDEDCFLCTKRVNIPGAFSESLSSPLIRIDYVQHAWAGLSHGARALGL
jgi:hypothetical protein